MRISAAVAVVLAVCGLVLPTKVWGQNLSPWNALPAQTAQGKVLRITLLDGTISTGNLVRLSGDAIVLAVNGKQVSHAAGSVAEIRKRGDSIWDGAVLGAAIGAGLGLATAIAWQKAETKNKGGTGTHIGAGALYGFGVGISIDAMRRGTTAIYRLAAPARP